MINIDGVPEPSRYIKHSIVEEIATRCNHLYRERRSHASGYPVDVEAFADLDLEITIVWDRIEEPEHAAVFARCCPDPEVADCYIVTLNTRHKELFKERPDILRSCIGHEVAHCVLRNHKWGTAPEGAGTLFDDLAPEPRCLHDSSWNQYGLTTKEMGELYKRAAIDKEVRQRIAQLSDRMEPDWMFWQAEHFSMCFLIPRDRLFQFLNEGREVSSWFAIRQLAKDFGVSPSMMRVRLTKLGAIQVENGKPKLGPMLLQPGVLR
jgi:hypothetical protein